VALIAALAASGTLIPAAAGSAPACAASGGGPHAGLVVGTGSQTLTYCVAMDGDTVSGIHLIELASAQYGLQYRLGYGGQAVCQLDGIGPDGDDCFADYPYFWGYWHGDGGTGWTWASTGAGSARVGDGDMDGWTWGTGMSGDTHQAPPHLSFDDVCSAETTPPPTTPPPTTPPTTPPTSPPTRPPTTPPHSSPPGTTPPTGGAGGAHPRSSSPTGSNASPSGSASAAATHATATEPSGSAATGAGTEASGPIVHVAAGSPAPADGGGGSAGTVIAIIAAVVLVAAGLFRMRAGRQLRAAISHAEEQPDARPDELSEGAGPNGRPPGEPNKP
jgi:hypothetical protein